MNSWLKRRSIGALLWTISVGDFLKDLTKECYKITVFVDDVAILATRKILLIFSVVVESASALD